MKKLLIMILALAVAVGGYFVVNLNWAALFETSSTLTEDEARSLVLEKFGGEIVSISYNDSAPPYYVAEVQVAEETIVTEVDAISSRITTKQVMKGESDDANKPELPLTKERATELALTAFEGELVNVLLVERDGNQYYEVELQSDREQAVITYDLATGELVENETAERANNTIQSVASSIKGVEASRSNASSGSSSVTSGTSKNSGTSSSEEMVEKPTISETKAPSTVALTIDQAEQIALRKVNGEVQSAKVTSDHVFEFEINQHGKLYIVKINATNGLTIEISSK